MTPESGAEQLAAADSGSSSTGPGAVVTTTADGRTAAMPSSEASSATPGTPSEDIQDLPLDVPHEVGSSATGSGDAGGRYEIEPERDAHPAPITSSIPGDGALGVAPDVVLVIDFGRSMDPSTVPGAIVSDDLPLGGASFAWDADNRVARITLAEPLGVASGDDPAQVVAHCYSYRVSEAAIDAEGQALLPSDVSFCTARRITRTLPAISDTDLSGNFRSDGVYGDGACAIGSGAVCVGDSGFVPNASYRGFLTFDASALPQPLLVLAAELRMETDPDAGTPFDDLGELLVEQARFDSIGAGPFSGAEPAPLGAMTRAPDADSTLLADTGALRRDESDRIQLRLRFANGTDGDGLADHIHAPVSAISLSVSYDVP